MGKCQDTGQMASVSLGATTPFLAEGRGGPLRRLGGEWGREDGESLQTGAPRSHSREGGSAASRVGGHRALWNASPPTASSRGGPGTGGTVAGCGGRVRTAQRACVSPPHPLQGEGCSPRLSSEAVDRAPSPAGEEDSTGPGLSAVVATTRGPGQGPAQVEARSPTPSWHGGHCSPDPGHRDPGRGRWVDRVSCRRNTGHKVVTGPRGQEAVGTGRPPPQSSSPPPPRETPAALRPHSADL